MYRYKCSFQLVASIFTFVARLFYSFRQLGRSWATKSIDRLKDLAAIINNSLDHIRLRNEPNQTCSFSLVGPNCSRCSFVITRRAKNFVAREIAIKKKDWIPRRPSFDKEEPRKRSQKPIPLRPVGSHFFFKQFHLIPSGLTQCNIRSNFGSGVELNSR